MAQVSLKVEDVGAHNPEVFVVQYWFLVFEVTGEDTLKLELSLLLFLWPFKKDELIFSFGRVFEVQLHSIIRQTSRGVGCLVSCYSL